MTESMWNLPDVSKIRTPLSVLREQATALSSQTLGRLLGVVDATGINNEIQIDLRIAVPSLNNYRYSLCRYVQPAVDFYPGHFYSLIHDDVVVVSNLTGFENRLNSIIKSKETDKLLASLLAQSQ